MCLTIKGWLLSLLAVVAGWFAILATVPLVSDATPAALVLWPDQSFVANLPEGIAITGAGSGWVVVAGTTPALAARLYQAGATLVLPAGLRGCLPFG